MPPRTIKLYSDYKSPTRTWRWSRACALERGPGDRSIGSLSPLTSQPTRQRGRERGEPVLEENRTAEQWRRVEATLQGRAALRVAARSRAAGHDEDLGLIARRDRHAVGEGAGSRRAPRLPRARSSSASGSAELDIEDVAVIEAVLRESGATIAGFREHAVGRGRAAHEAAQRAIFDAGIFGVPSYVVGGELFFGREHLPRIRELLAPEATR